jgi:hypothetical protein
MRRGKTMSLDADIPERGDKKVICPAGAFCVAGFSFLNHFSFRTPNTIGRDGTAHVKLLIEGHTSCSSFGRCPIDGAELQGYR